MFSVEVNYKYDDEQQFKRWADFTTNLRDWGAFRMPRQALEVFGIDLYRIKDPDLYKATGPTKIQGWQQEALGYFLALKFQPDWSQGSGKGITFTINVKEKNEDLRTFTLIVYSDTYVPKELTVGGKMVGGAKQAEGSSKYDAITLDSPRSKWGWNIDDGETGLWFVNEIAKNAGQIMQLDPDLILKNAAIENMVGENYTFNKLNAAYGDQIAGILRGIATGQIHYDDGTTADGYKYSIVLSDEQWDMVTPTQHWQSGHGVWQLGSTKSLTEKTIKGEDLESTGTSASTTLAHLSDSVINDLTARDITLIKGIGGTGKGTVGGGHAKTEQDAFGEQLAEMAGQIQNKTLSEYNLIQGKAAYSHFFDWRTALSMTLALGRDIKDWATDAETDQNTLKAILTLIYSNFLMDVMQIEDSGSEDMYTPIVEAWKKWTEDTATIYKLTDIILTDKEITRRVAKWNFLADLDRDKYRTSGNLIMDIASGQVADDVYKQMGQAQAAAFASGDVPEAEDKLTKEEIENRKKFYKQCALMLNAHTLRNQLETRFSLQRSEESIALRGEEGATRPPGEMTEYPFDGRFWMAKCQEDQERLIGNLVSSPAAALFFDIPPPLMTYLTPKIKLFRVSNPKGGKTKEVEFVFGHSADINRTQNYTKPQATFLDAPFDKGSGCGLKEFSFEFNGTNPAEARNDITATLTLFFQSFNDFIKERVGATGDIYRFVDLVIQPKPDQEDNKLNGVEIVHPNQYDPSFYRIRAEVGYYEPDGEVPFIGQSLTDLRDAITTTNKSFFLCMVDHNINVNADGTVTIEISYRAYVETALKSLRFDAISTPELTDKRKKMQDGLIKMLTSGDCTEQQIKDYKAAQSGVEEELKRRSLQSIVRRLLDRGRIYILKISEGAKSHFLERGYFEKRPKPISIKKVDPPPGGESPGEVLENAGDTSKFIGDILETELPDLVDYDYTNMQDTSIQFFFFGDLLHTINDIMYQQDSPLTPIIGMENNKYILGSFDFDAYSGDGDKGTVLNVAQIPIAVDFFSQWFTDQVLTKGKTRKSFPIISFIRNLCNNVLQNSLLEACVNRKIKKTLRFATGQVTAYSESGEDPLAILCKNSPTGIINTDGATENLPLKGDSSDANKTDKIQNFYNYITLNVLGSSLTYTGDGNYAEDIEDGRFHVNIGSNRGIVKTISFEKADIQYIREARFMQQGIDGLLQLSAVYNASIEMFGNTLFYPGMEVFINPFGIGGTEFGSPTKGPTSEGGRSMANILGIGGYHTITNVATSLTPEKFSTTIKALQYYSGDGQGNPNLDGQVPEDSEIHAIDGPQGEDEKKFCVGHINDVLHVLDEQSVEQLLPEVGPIDATPTPATGESSTGGSSAPGATIDDPALPSSTFVFAYDTSPSSQNPGTINFSYNKTSGAASYREFTLNNIKQATLIVHNTPGGSQQVQLVMDVHPKGSYWASQTTLPTTLDLEDPDGEWTGTGPDEEFLKEHGWDVIPPEPPPEPPAPPAPAAGSVEPEVIAEEVYTFISLVSEPTPMLDIVLFDNDIHDDMTTTDINISRKDTKAVVKFDMDFGFYSAHAQTIIKGNDFSKGLAETINLVAEKANVMLELREAMGVFGSYTNVKVRPKDIKYSSKNYAQFAAVGADVGRSEGDYTRTSFQFFFTLQLPTGGE